MQENKFKMKHLMAILKALKLNSVSELLNYLQSCFEYENEVATKADEVKYYNFVLACLVNTKSISENEASDLILNTETMYKIGVEYQNEIVGLQTIAKEPADPNVTATT